MAKALYKGQIIAESEDTVKVEGNHYFPLSSINKELLEGSELQTTCVWKGVANYYNLIVGGEKLSDMVWYYPNPSEEAKSIKGRIAFYQKDGISVIE